MRPLARISIIAGLVALVTLLVWLASRISAFAHIFLEDSRSGIIVRQTEAAAAHNASTPDLRTQYIPKKLHQVFHNWKNPGDDTLPADWDKVRQTCIDANPDWEYKLWTEKESREFLEREYAWFLKTYDSYRFKVQRVDAVRYFILLHYGGIYLDLDNGCMGSLDALTYYPMWITDPGRGALSNNVLATRPNHPFWALLTQSLRAWNYHYFFPYVTISYASGQWFVSAIWEQYHAMLPKIAPGDTDPAHDHRLHRLMMDDRAEFDTWLYFTQERGGTWVNWDNRMFLWIGDHLFLFVLGVAGLIGGTTWLGLRALRRYRGYTALKGQPERYEL